MEKRIIVRTLANVSYVGNICKDILFNEEGILLKPHPKLRMKVFIPKEEIKELAVDGQIITYEQFME